MYVLGVSLSSQESEQSCVCVRGVNFTSSCDFLDWIFELF